MKAHLYSELISAVYAAREDTIAVNA